MIADLVRVAFDAYMLILLVRVIVSWVSVDPRHPLMVWLVRVTEPVLQPIRSVLPPLAGLDFSPVVALLALSLLRRIVAGLFH